MMNTASKQRPVEKENWIRVENTHEPIIDRQLWDKVQKLLTKKHRDIDVILSIVLFFVVPDKIAIQWVGTSPSNAVDSYYVFLVPVLSVLFAFTGKPIFTMFLFRLWNRTNEHLVTYLNLCLQVVFLTCEIYIGLYNLCNFNVAISIILIVELMIDVVIGLKLFHNQSI